jgi:hypothetical protein
MSGISLLQAFGPLRFNDCFAVWVQTLGEAS